MQQHTLFVNPIHTNTTPGHYVFTYYYFLGTYSVFVCIGQLISEQNNGMMLPKHTLLLVWESRGKIGMLNVIYCYDRKNNFIVSKSINKITLSLRTNTQFGNLSTMIVLAPTEERIFLMIVSTKLCKQYIDLYQIIILKWSWVI